MPPPESGAWHRLGGPASPADQGLQARENLPTDGRMLAVPSTECGSNGAADRPGPKKKAISLPRKNYLNSANDAPSTIYIYILILS